MVNGKFKIVLFGHFQLFSPEGIELSVDGLGEKSQGLLAILATRPNQPVARTYLQDKLWSDRAELQGRNSLKQALRQIRTVFAKNGGDVVRTNGGPVFLDRERVWIDIHDASPNDDNAQFPGEFLEGIDIRDPQFNIWLSSIRSTDWTRSAHALADLRAGVQTSPMKQEMIGIMPIVTADNDPKATILGNLVVDRIVNAVSFYELFGFHDFRQVDGESARGCDYLMMTQAISLGDEVSLSMTMLQAANNRRIWGHQILLEAKNITSDRLAQISVQICDRLLHCVDSNNFAISDEKKDAAKLVMEGIDRLFRPSAPSVQSAVSAFERACELEPKSSYLAWQAYSSAHVLELETDKDRTAVLERTEILAAQALERDPFNPLTRILLTHVYGFIFRDMNRADSLIGPLSQNPPDTPLYYYSLGCLRNYQKDLDAARRAAYLARILGKHSPYSHMFSSLATMTASMSGDFKSAIRMGEESLSRQPKSIPGFGPTLRYLAAAYANTGNIADAVGIYDKLRAQSPNFNATQLLEPAFPVPSAHARSLLYDAFTKIEQSVS